MGSGFCNDRVRSLCKVIKESGLDNSWFYQGLKILQAHRIKYGSGGPSNLTVLWWERPRIHWKDLRLGTSMNFMDTPTPVITASKDLKVAAIKFVDGLISLNVLCCPPPSITVVNIFPLFLVPKPGQAGEFCTIANGKQGVQNDVCVADPYYMKSPDHILSYYIHVIYLLL